MRVMARWWWVMVLGCLVISVMGIRRWEFFAVRGKTFNVGTGTSGVIKSHNVSSTPAILHSRQQLNIGLKMSDRFDTSELLVDLRNTPDGAFKRTWSDGTPFNVKFNNMIHDLTKTDEPYFRIKGNEYHAKNDGNNHFLCQC
ncbi:hypothetical protein Hamer_G025309 [Homarus americanus]|uniref:Uncharacterized protein n=1 Tax=Homarus americanus TaxID=6706 RepID=A0A8J5K837_HOMAM|nr:hypothetical protein Hamer_G025309 [Homarus americanus]